MSELAREGIKQWMADNHGTVIPYEDCTCEDCAVGYLALRALDMRDGLERLFEGEIPITIRAADIGEVIEKFDGASDEQKRDPAGEWGGGRTR